LQAYDNYQLISSSLPEAIEACIDAAGYEFDVSRQHALLNAATYGLPFCRFYFLHVFGMLVFYIIFFRYCKKSHAYLSTLLSWNQYILVISLLPTVCALQNEKSCSNLNVLQNVKVGFYNNVVYQYFFMGMRSIGCFALNLYFFMSNISP
jgi:hypothetical protein